MPDGHEKIQGAQVIYSNVTRKHSGRFLKQTKKNLNVPTYIIFSKKFQEHIFAKVPMDQDMLLMIRLKLTSFVSEPITLIKKTLNFNSISIRILVTYCILYLIVHTFWGNSVNIYFPI